MLRTRKITSGCALALLTAVASRAGDATFQAPQALLSTAPVAVLAGDFNGDGRPDLFSSGWLTPVQTYLTNTNGVFTLVRGKNAILATNSAVLADFNGDGNLDAAVSSESPEQISVFLGNGKGQLRSTPIVTNLGASAMAAGDLNGDGITDLVIVPFPTGGPALQLQVLLGRGDGSFKKPQTINTSLAGGFNPVLIDLNGDGKLDLVYAYSYTQLYTQLGNGDGTFGEPIAFTQTGGSMSTTAVGDVNGDGKPDLVASCYVNSVYSICVALGNGDGSFTSAGSTPVPLEVYHLALGDFNEDGHMDIAAVGEQYNGQSTQLMILTGDGEGAFTLHASFFWDNGGDLVAGDFNGDGHLDLATGNGSGSTIDVTWGDGHGNFVALQGPNAGPAPAHGVAAADFNHDGKMDLAIVNGGFLSGTVHEVDILPGNGDGTYQAPVAVQVGKSPWDIAVADLNHDGVLDMVVTDTGSPTGIWVLLGQSGGGYKAPVFYAGPTLSGLIAADVNGDGTPDLISLASDNGKVVVWLGNGDGTFGAGHGYSAGKKPMYMALADFNGDGKPDLAITDREGNAVSILLGNGDGTFGAPTTPAAVAQPVGIVAGDFNGDGRMDLAVASEKSGTVEIYLGNGDGTFQTPTSVPVQGSARLLSIGDFNGDGNLDLAVTAQLAYGVTILTGNGAGQFTAGVVLDPGGNPQVVLPADLNGDGRPDLAIMDVVTGSVGYLTIGLNTSN